MTLSANKKNLVIIRKNRNWHIEHIDQDFFQQLKGFSIFTFYVRKQVIISSYLKGFFKSERPFLGSRKCRSVQKTIYVASDSKIVELIDNDVDVSVLQGKYCNSALHNKILNINIKIISDFVGIFSFTDKVSEKVNVIKEKLSSEEEAQIFKILPSYPINKNNNCFMTSIAVLLMHPYFNGSYLLYMVFIFLLYMMNYINTQKHYARKFNHIKEILCPMVSWKTSFSNT
jgi:hypothetical protein